jgi:hypothetical protein
MKKILSFSSTNFGTYICFNKVKVDSLFQVLKTNDKFMGSVAVSENGKIIYTNAIGKDDMANNKRQLLARNIELVLYLKCLLQF